MSKSVALLLVLFFLTASCIAVKPAMSYTDIVENSWVSKAPMRQARSGLGVATVNGKIYAIGGGVENGYVGTNEQYNPATDTWSFKESMPTPRSDFGIAVYQNKIYCIGGRTSDGVTGVNEVYDPETDSWETKPPIPTPRLGLGANVVNGKIYFIGGWIGNPSPGYSYLNLTSVYNPETDFWSTKASMPTGVSGRLSAVVDDKIYVFMPNPNLNQIYDTETDSWSLEGAPLPYFSMVYAYAGATIGVNASKRIYVVGDSGTLVYDPVNDSWINGAAVPTDREGFGVAVVNDILYAIGGYTATYQDYPEDWMYGPKGTLYASNEQYTPFGYGTPDPSYDGTAPEIAVVSPENKTYYTADAGLNFTDIALNFTVDEPVFSVHYVLDGDTPVEISGNMTLAGLGIGVHNVTVFGFDASGNRGTSETIFFAIEEPESFPTIPVAVASVAAFAGVIIGLMLYFRKRKQ
jgi:N-acetylneuraminic acid mutarotase